MNWIIITLGVVCTLFLSLFFIYKNKYKSIYKKHSFLEKKVKELSVYQECIDASEKSKLIIKEAEEKAEDIEQAARNKADLLIYDTENELESSKQKISENKKKAEYIIATANNTAEEQRLRAVKQAEKIIIEARQEAQSIAGEAYEIAQKADFYKETVVAIKNILNGYGDKYIKPSFIYLYQLADDFGYDDAGKMLKDSIAKSEALIKSDLAADCDYVEDNRKKTAKNFVLDAFNGKVDSILTQIKKENYGVLEQKIKDAFYVVNYLGSAFRNARITKAYLDSRLEELKWTIAVIELKQKEKEEQRRIKEQIREEEKARREYEKAIKEAQKEEESIKKLMEKVQQSIEKATSQQKEMYEKRLEELKIKLEEAESKNKRALSMAQQTKSGHVYIISNIGSFGENVYKIGMTRRLEPTDRVKELGDASVPFPFDIHAMIYSDDAPSLEYNLHKLFVQNQVNKVNSKKEFFRVPISEIKNEIEKMGLDAKWTITALATEYKESLAIERNIEASTSEKEKWIQSQDLDTIQIQENE